MAMTKNFASLAPWQEMLDKKRLKRFVLKKKPTFLDLSDPKIKKQYVYRKMHNYYDGEVPSEPLKESTIFFFEPGLHRPLPGHKVEVAGVYLKNVIHEDVWRAALGDKARGIPGLTAMEFEKPRRSETRPAIDRQKGLVDAGELAFGTSHQGNLQKAHAHKTEEQNYAALGPLFKLMDLIFATVLPAYWFFQSETLPLAERERILAGQKPREFGGALNRFRHFGTSFTNSALLKSCPSAIHLDSNSGAGPNVTNQTCLTSCGDGFEGGTFCLIEYGIRIAVTPGDLFIGQTSRLWHTNIGRVKGTKYSIVAYMRPYLGKPGYATITADEETWEDRLTDWFMRSTTKEGDFFELPGGGSKHIISEEGPEDDE
jgi:hypothetical protein